MLHFTPGTQESRATWTKKHRKQQISRNYNTTLAIIITCLALPRFLAIKEGKRSVRVSIIAALHLEKLLAPLTFEGYCNRQVFEKWLEERLLPVLLPGEIIILDNATFQKSEKIRELIEKAKCELKYLPHYSPDLNEIEHQWFPIKNRVIKMGSAI